VTIRPLALAVGLAALLSSATAAAYSSPALYAADPVRTGGGGGRVFSGSPADGFTCAVCHTGDAPPSPALRGWSGGPYDPGATYQLELAWPEEHFGAVFEITDRSGAPLGTLRLPPSDGVLPDERCAGGSRAAERIELPDERTAVAVGDCGAHLLRVQWTAPLEHVPGALHLAAVVADGDGTPAGDGAAIRSFPLGPEDPSGCAIGGGVGVWFLLLLLRRRRAALLVLLSFGTACARVQPHQRGRLAQPDMQLGGDPDLGAGTEHALEYREGSAGGLGGGGGGCGCN
jgi:hypothetical protein